MFNICNKIILLDINISITNIILIDVTVLLVIDLKNIFLIKIFYSISYHHNKQVIMF